MRPAAALVVLVLTLLSPAPDPARAADVTFTFSAAVVGAIDGVSVPASNTVPALPYWAVLLLVVGIALACWPLLRRRSD